MNTIQTDAFQVFFGNESYKKLNKFVVKQQFSKIIILVDEHTEIHCLPILLNRLNTSIPIDFISIPSGEISKNLRTCTQVWNDLLKFGADRSCLLINLGGGMVTDLGGFVASTYKRGISFINIPTSLLAMVDAAVGGKTGVDFGNLKNIIGVFSNPEMILIDVNYLSTLPQRELKCGLAEVIKYGLIADMKLWNQIRDDKQLNNSTLKSIIYHSVNIKLAIVQQDFFEKNVRKTLNFGHTIGHAIESYLLDKKYPLNHGEAIAIGMVVELYISHNIFQFPLNLVDELKEFVHHYYGKIALDLNDINDLIPLLNHDKKNEFNKVLFVLLKSPEQPQINCEVSHELIVAGIEYYLN